MLVLLMVAAEIGFWVLLASGLAPLVACALEPAARRAPGRRAAGEPVREALVGPADDAVPERDREADVGGRQTVRRLGGGTAAEVDYRRGEQHQVQQRRAHQEHHTQPAPA
jgi:hypothetical protein